MMWHIGIGGVKHEFYIISLQNLNSYINNPFESLKGMFFYLQLSLLESFNLNILLDQMLFEPLEGLRITTNPTGCFST